MYVQASLPPNTHFSLNYQLLGGKDYSYHSHNRPKHIMNWPSINVDEQICSKSALLKGDRVTCKYKPVILMIAPCLMFIIAIK